MFEVSQVSVSGIEATKRTPLVYKKLDKYFLRLYINAAGMLPDRSPGLWRPQVFERSVLRFRRGAQRQEYLEGDGRELLEVRFQNAKHFEDVGIPAAHVRTLLCIVLRHGFFRRRGRR